MKTDIKNVNLFAPKWWNPLFWLVVVLGPLAGMVAGTLAGAFCGLLIGYGKGLETARKKVQKIIGRLP